MDRLLEPKSSIRLTRLAAWGLVLAVGIVVVRVAPLWYFLLAPRWLVRAVAIGFLWALLAVIVATVPAAVAGLFAGLIAAYRGWRRDEADAVRRALRWTLLAASCVASLFMMESVSAVLLRRALRIAALPTRFPARTKSNAGGGLYLVVVGESSAMGEPYGPWLSVGPIVGWQLEHVFPGRKIRVDVRAEGGLRLEQALRFLFDLRERPERGHRLRRA